MKLQLLFMNFSPVLCPQLTDFFCPWSRWIVSLEALVTHTEVSLHIVPLCCRHSRLTNETHIHTHLLFSELALRVTHMVSAGDQVLMGPVLATSGLLCTSKLQSALHHNNELKKYTREGWGTEHQAHMHYKTQVHTIMNRLIIMRTEGPIKDKTSSKYLECKMSRWQGG